MPEALLRAQSNGLDRFVSVYTLQQYTVGPHVYEQMA